MRVRPLIHVLLLAAAAVPSSARAQSAEDVRSAQEIRALFEGFNAAWERRDPDFIRSYYAHDTTGVFFFDTMAVFIIPDHIAGYQYNLNYPFVHHWYYDLTAQ